AMATRCPVAVLRVLGGEPLMHPNLLDIMMAVRESHIAEKIEITTNGVLLPRLERRFWEMVDSVRISLCPGHSLREDQLDACIDLAHQNNVLIRYRRV